MIKLFKRLKRYVFGGVPYTRIIVTSEDINEGYKNSSSRCPIALAVRKEYPNGYGAATREYIRLNDIRYTIPEEALIFMHSFDTGYPVMPFSFAIGEKL